MNINPIINNIKFILSQNFKNQKFKKEYYVKFDPEVNNFIKTYFAKIPKELDINRNLDLLSNINFRDRLKNYNLIKNILNKYSNFEKKEDKLINKNLIELNKEGITDMEFLNLSKIEIDNITNSLDLLPRYKGHTIHHSEGNPVFKNEMQENNFYCFDTRKILEISEVQKILNNDNLKNFVKSYFNCLPTLNSFNVYVTTKSTSEKGVQLFHRDNEDFKTLNIFFLLKKTKPKDGGHAFIRRSHNPDTLKEKITEKKFKKIKVIAKENYGITLSTLDDLCNLPKDSYGFEKIFDELKDLEIDVHGNAGKVFAEDNFGLHKSIKNQNDRIIFWLSFSLTSVGTTRYCISHKILRRFIPKRIEYSKIKKNLNKSFFERYVYRYYVNFGC